MLHPWKDISQKKWLDWRWQFKNRVNDLAGLGHFLKKSASGGELTFAPGYKKVTQTYRFAATPYYLSLIDWDDRKDPIRLQCIPDPRELSFKDTQSSDDPLCEEEHMPVKGLIHRYPDRALMLLSNTCAAYCRHCNRKRYWSRPEGPLKKDELEHIYLYLNGAKSVREVLLSGGDPLLMNLKALEEILKELRKISHIEVIRIGTRLPVTLPMRITPRLSKMLRKYRPIWVNTHFNHPKEITREAEAACDMLISSGLPVSNQTVLLKGVNDSLETIMKLCQGLQKIMVRPYYLFHCDMVRGTDHFRTRVSKGIEIMEGLWGRTGGLTIPNYVVDLPQGGGKARAVPSHIVSMNENEVVFQTMEGKMVKYHECDE